MKKMRTSFKVRTLFLMTVLGVSLFMAGCGNRRIGLKLGSNLQYNFASVYAPDGKVVHSGALDSWKDHEDATVDLWFEDGTKFLAHSINVVMSNNHLDYGSMIILVPKKESRQSSYRGGRRFDFDDDKLYPPFLHDVYPDGYDNLGDGWFDATLHLPERAMWNAGFTNYHLEYDFKEQVYKKRKSYFHISDKPHPRINAKNSNGKWVAPVAFFAMDVKTCIDFYAAKISGMHKSPKAFLHHCANNGPLNLFNPDSNDINRVPFPDIIRNEIIKLRASPYPNRYWAMLEQRPFMGPVYKYQKGKDVFDGMALNFKGTRTGDEERTEGIGLFSRGSIKMDVMRIAVIEDVFSDDFDPRNLFYNNPDSIKMSYRDGML